MAQGVVAQRNDLVTQFRQMQNPDGSPVDPVEIAIEIGNIVIAGADTTVN
jgi:cytochrome P450